VLVFVFVFVNVALVPFRHSLDEFRTTAVAMLHALGVFFPADRTEHSVLLEKRSGAAFGPLKG
jgi:hypothetical protein